jgi:hypothetical protein
MSAYGGASPQLHPVCAHPSPAAQLLLQYALPSLTKAFGPSALQSQPECAQLVLVAMAYSSNVPRDASGDASATRP